MCKVPTITNGEVYPNDAINSGESYTAICEKGYKLNGNGKIKCDNGELSAIPTCQKEDGPKCKKPEVKGGNVEPDSSISSGESYTVTCESGYKLNGDGIVKCNDGQLSAIPTCQKEDEQKCKKPEVKGGNVEPDSSISSGESYTVTCESGYKLNGDGIVKCNDGQLSAIPTCQKEDEQKCKKPEVKGGNVKPDSSISSGESYTVTCESGYKLNGNGTVKCNDGELSAIPTCEKEDEPKCKKPEVKGGNVEPDSSISSGESYTVTCKENYVINGDSILKCNSGTLPTKPSCTKRKYDAPADMVAAKTTANIV